MTDNERVRLITETKNKLEDAKRKAAKAEGGMDAVLMYLKEHEDCNSISEAKEKLAEKEEALEKAKKKLDSLLAEFQDSPLFQGDE